VGPPKREAGGSPGRLDVAVLAAHTEGMFLNPGDTPPLSTGNPTHPGWIVDDIVGKNPSASVHQFWFEFPKMVEPEIADKLKAAGADRAGHDGSSNIAIVVAKTAKLRALVEICLVEGGRYSKDLSRV
jgi:hypothetical protein